jgi:hypothetical protein
MTGYARAELDSALSGHEDRVAQRNASGCTVKVADRNSKAFHGYGRRDGRRLLPELRGGPQRRQSSDCSTNLG